MIDPNTPPQPNPNIVVKSVTVSVAVDLTTGQPVEGQAWNVNMDHLIAPPAQWKEAMFMLTEGIRICLNAQAAESQQQPSRVLRANGVLGRA